jgi:hypothetical protein
MYRLLAGKSEKIVRERFGFTTQAIAVNPAKNTTSFKFLRDIDMMPMYHIARIDAYLPSATYFGFDADLNKYVVAHMMSTQ